MKIQKLIDSLAFTELLLSKSCSMTLLRNPTYKCHFFFEIHMGNFLQAVLLLVALAYAEPEAAPDAKADAEAAPWYYGYYGHPGYYGGWGGYYGRRWGGYYGYGYPYRYWWKRSAEEQQPESQHIVKRSADADADADASPESWYYGYYGHPYRWGGYYRGYYGYGYPGYYWG